MSRLIVVPPYPHTALGYGDVSFDAETAYFDSLDAVSISDEAISLMKCILEMLDPATLVLLNLFILARYFQSQMLIERVSSFGLTLSRNELSPNAIAVIRHCKHRVKGMESKLQWPSIVV